MERNRRKEREGKSGGIARVVVKDLAVLTSDSPKLIITLVNTVLITEFNLHIYMLRFPKGAICGV